MLKPKYLYKYCSATRASQILADLTFYMAPAAAQNDLYELRGNALFTEDAGSKYRLFARRLVSEGWYKQLDEAEAAARKIDESAVDETFAVYKAQLFTDFRLIREHSGVTCFTAHRNNQRMWGTYGASHSGAVIEFSTSEAMSPFTAHLTPVLYTQHRLPVCISTFMSLDGTRDESLLPALCSVKEWSWRDEDEWRLLLLSDSPQSTAERIVPFPRSSVTRVFLGPRIADQDRAGIERVAEAQDPPIPVFAREIDVEEAKEELAGVEHITSEEQFLYWVGKMSTAGPVTTADEGARRRREEGLVERVVKMLRNR